MAFARFWSYEHAYVRVHAVGVVVVNNGIATFEPNAHLIYYINVFEK